MADKLLKVISNAKYSVVEFSLNMTEVSPLIPEKPVGKPHGLSVITAVTFVAGEMAGSGTLALPGSVARMSSLNQASKEYSLKKLLLGWPGLPLIAFCAVNAAYNGYKLGITWEVLKEKYPDLKGQIRDPYPKMAERAGLVIGPRMAKTMKLVAVCCMVMTSYGSTIVYIELIASLAYDISSISNICMWMVIAAVVIGPLTLFGTPDDFW